MSGTVTAVVFDLGGVITESPMTAFAAYEREAGLPEGLIRQLNSTDPDTNAWARFERNELDVAGFSEAFEAEAAALGHRLDAGRVLAALRGEVRPAMVAAIRRLREAGLPLGMVSNNVSPMERGGRMDDILDLFDVIVESSIEGVRKPEPEIYERTLSRLGLDAHQCAFVDDLEINVLAANELGLRGVHFRTTEQTIAELDSVLGT